MPKSATCLYELMLVFQPDLLETAKDKKLRDFEKFLEENGGKVKMKDDWGKRKLAYRISKFDTGIYVVLNLILPPSFNKELDEHMRIDKDIIRFLLTAVADDYTYAKFDEEKKMEPKPEASTMSRKTSSVSHKAFTGTATTDVKDKGKKADAVSLDSKLGKLLEGGDLNM